MHSHKSKLLLLTGIFFLSISINHSHAQDINTPIIDELNLKIDGTGGVFVNITKDFDYIMRIIGHLHFVANSIDFDNFAGESTALTNGFLIYYNDITMGSGAIKTNGDMGDAGYDVSLSTDDKNPKGRVLLTRLTFSKFNIVGLLINSEITFGIKVQDNITALSSLDELTVFVEGYKIVGKIDDQTQSIQTDKREIGFITPDNIFTAGMTVLMGVVVYTVYLIMFKD